MRLEGNIIAGEFDNRMNEFSLLQVKHLSVESTINENQMKQLYNYLKKHEHDADGQIISLYDQLLVRLSQEEIQLLLLDLEKVQSLYH